MRCASYRTISFLRFPIRSTPTLQDTPITLDNIVRGLTKNPRVKTLHKIALAFTMTLAEFLDFEELNDYSFEDDTDMKHTTI